ncbi:MULTISPECIES: hypothetical protein [unclassified Kitasatospora]
MDTEAAAFRQVGKSRGRVRAVDGPAGFPVVFVAAAAALYRRDTRRA